MRTFFSFAIMLIIATPLFAQTQQNCQTLTLRQLLTLTSKNLDDFETYVRNKCYYQSGTSDLNGHGEEHDYKFRNEEISNGDIVRLGILSSDGSKFVAYLTISETKYTSFKKELPTLGFKYVNSKKNGETTTMKYTSAQYDVHVNYIDKAGTYKYNFSISRK